MFHLDQVVFNPLNVDSLSRKWMKMTIMTFLRMCRGVGHRHQNLVFLGENDWGLILSWTSGDAASRSLSVKLFLNLCLVYLSCSTINPRYTFVFIQFYSIFVFCL